MNAGNSSFFLHSGAHFYYFPGNTATRVFPGGLSLAGNEWDQVIKTRKYPIPQDTLAFSEASKFGNYLSEVPENQRDRIKPDIKGKLGSHTTDKGVKHTMEYQIYPNSNFCYEINSSVFL